MNEEITSLNEETIEFKSEIIDLTEENSRLKANIADHKASVELLKVKEL